MHQRKNTLNPTSQHADEDATKKFEELLFVRNFVFLKNQDMVPLVT